MSDLLTDREKSASVDTIKYQGGFISLIPAYFIKDNCMEMLCLQSVQDIYSLFLQHPKIWWIYHFVQYIFWHSSVYMDYGIIYYVYCDEINVWLALYTVCNRFIFCSTYEWWVFMFSYFFCVQLYWNVFQFPNYIIKAHSPWLDIIFLMKWKSIVNKLYFSCYL